MTDALAGTVKVPGIGPMKKPVLFGSIGVAMVIVIVAYKRHSSASASTAATTATSPDPNSIDPNSPYGYTYAQEAGTANNNGFYSSGANGTGIIGYDSQGQPVYGQVPTPSAASQAYQTNADWTMAAVNVLEAEGVTVATSTTAIAHILGGLQVTSAQQDLFMQAVGLLGTGPPNGYPKPIRLVDTPATPAPGTGSGSSTGSGSGSSPGTGSTGSGSTPVTPHAPGSVSGSATSHTSIAVHWSASAGAQSYQVRVTYQSSVIKTEMVSGTSATVSGLTPNHTYGVHVVAIGAGNKWSSESSTSVHTPK